MNEIKIIIAAPSYTTNYGGIVVLHKLSHILNEIGYDSYMIDFTGNGGYVKLNPNFNTKTIDISKIDYHNDIIVYPEVTHGNPYGIKKCVRYILYYNSIRNLHKTWGDDDFWIYYRDEYYDSMKNKNILTVVDTKVDLFKNLNLHRDINSAFLIKKGGDYPHISKKYHPVDSIELTNWSDDLYLLNFFNRCVRFYSYDYNTYLNNIASLCGCESILVPINGISIDTHRLNNTDRLHGIAYGLEDLDSCKTSNILRSELDDKETRQFNEVYMMFKKIIKQFNISI